MFYSAESKIQPLVGEIRRSLLSALKTPASFLKIILLRIIARSKCFCIVGGAVIFLLLHIF